MQFVTLARLRHVLLALAFSLGTGSALAQVKAVFHIDNAQEQALAGLRNVKNFLDTEPNASIVVVTHANGVDFLMNDAKDRNGNPYEVAVELLHKRGVRFEVCEITLRNRSLKKEQFIEEAAFVPSGVVELAKLQAQGYAYIKP
ncbi:MAG: DsrE family protein [Proteobacteria bacterium]|nr:DsrE family protein [Pseudomonadota bacterium]